MDSLKDNKRTVCWGDSDSDDDTLGIVAHDNYVDQVGAALTLQQAWRQWRLTRDRKSWLKVPTRRGHKSTHASHKRAVARAAQNTEHDYVLFKNTFDLLAVDE